MNTMDIANKLVTLCRQGKNAEARDSVARMKLETLAEGKKRFGDSGKTIVEYFKTFQKVIASATDNGGNQLHPRTGVSRSSTSRRSTSGSSIAPRSWRMKSPISSQT